MPIDDPIARLLSDVPRKRKGGALFTTSAAASTPLTERAEVRVGFYARYSSHMQDDGWSIEAQHHAMARATTEHPEWVVTFYDEPARSARHEKLANRTRFIEMLRDATSGKLDLIVVHKLDRFSRSLPISIRVLDVLHGAGVGFLSLTEQMDLTTPYGWLQFNLLSTFADFYSRNLGAEIRKGKDARARAGLQACRPPYGYRYAPEKRTLEPDYGGDWEGLQRLHELMRSGMTDQEIVDTMLREGKWTIKSPSRSPSRSRPFSRGSVSMIRRNRFYRAYAPGDDRGTVIHNGEEHRGLHKAALTWDEWNALQDVAKGRRRGWMGYAAGLRPEAHTAEFRGLATCADCGGRLYVWRTVHDHNKRTGEPINPPIIYERYACTAADRGVECPSNRRWARVEDVRQAWMEWLAAHEFPADWQQHFRDLTVKSFRDEDAQAEDGTKVLNEIARWERIKETARKMALDGDMTHEEWIARRDEAEKAIRNLIASRRGVEQTVVRLVDAGKLVTSAAAIWELGTTQERQQLAALLIESRGLRLKLHGAMGQSHKWQEEGERPFSCTLVNVTLREPFGEVFRVLAQSEVG